MYLACPQLGFKLKLHDSEQDEVHLFFMETDQALGLENDDEGPMTTIICDF